jgi:magnesium transporter
MNESVRQEDRLTAAEIRDAWPLLSPEERVEAFQQLDRGTAQDFFLTLTARGKATIILGSPPPERRLWVRLLAPDDAADVIQEVPEESRGELLGLLDDATHHEVNALLAYRQDQAGGLMSPRFTRVRPEMTVDEAIRYLRLQARDHLEGIYYAYVLGDDQRLLGVASFRDLFRTSPEKQVSEIMKTEIVAVTERQDREDVAHLFSRHKFLALPVVDERRHLKGIITADDILHAVQAEATEDIHKLGGVEALDRPYLQMGFLQMLRKRAVWLALLFVGEMLTASAMAHYEEEIARAVVLALFVPLIISSGGNCGSQAATLVIRAMALGEIRLRDWWHIVKREVAMGAGLGCILAVIGLGRILAWQALFHAYGEYATLVAISVSVSLMGVVLWGTVAGSMLPFVLRRVGFDPASASAPFVATLVDVSGIVIYFSVSAVVLRGTLL